MSDLLERWKPIPEFSSYSVSNKGRVRNNKTNTFLKTENTGHKPSQIIIYEDGEIYKLVLRPLIHLVFPEIPLHSKLPV